MEIVKIDALIGFWATGWADTLAVLARPRNSTLCVVAFSLIPVTGSAQLRRLPPTGSGSTQQSAFVERFQKTLDITLNSAVKLILPVTLPGKQRQSYLITMVEGRDATDFKRTLQILKVTNNRLSVENEIPFIGNYPDCLISINSLLKPPVIVPGQTRSASAPKVEPLITTTEGIYSWQGNQLQRVGSSPTALRLSIERDERASLLLSGLSRRFAPRTTRATRPCAR